MFVFFGTFFLGSVLGLLELAFFQMTPHIKVFPHRRKRTLSAVGISLEFRNLIDYLVLAWSRYFLRQCGDSILFFPDFVSSTSFLEAPHWINQKCFLCILKLKRNNVTRVFFWIHAWNSSGVLVSTRNTQWAHSSEFRVSTHVLTRNRRSMQCVAIEGAFIMVWCHLRKHVPQMRCVYVSLALGSTHPGGLGPVVAAHGDSPFPSLVGPKPQVVACFPRLFPSRRFFFGFSLGFSLFFVVVFLLDFLSPFMKSFRSVGSRLEAKFYFPHQNMNFLGIFSNVNGGKSSRASLPGKVRDIIPSHTPR